jgi:hypothetical protein
MPTLLCLPLLTTEPTWEAKFLAEAVGLREAGESVTLWTERAIPLLPAMVEVHSAEAWEEAIENEAVPVLTQAHPPHWLALEEYHRVLVVCPDAGTENGNFLLSVWPGWSRLTQPHRELISALLERGAESVDLVHPDDALDLNQSWYSGRRVGVRLLGPNSE